MMYFLINYGSQNIWFTNKAYFAYTDIGSVIVVVAATTITTTNGPYEVSNILTFLYM